MKQMRGFTLALAVSTLLTGAQDVQARGTVPSDAEGEVTFTAGATVHCGDTLTTHTRLTHDLNCPSSAPFALQLDGADIVLDLGGYTIRRTGPANDESQGVVIARGRMVRNGTIRGFGSGITTTFNAGTLYVRLHELALLDNNIGVYDQASYGNFLITNSRLSGNGQGLSSAFDASDGNFDVRSSVFTHNATAMIADFHNIDVLDSTFTSNGVVIHCFGGAFRVRGSTLAWNDAVGRMQFDFGGPYTCNNMRFENSLLANNASFAPTAWPIWQTTRLEMVDTLAVSNGEGLEVQAETVYIDGNTFHDNAEGLSLADLPAAVPTPLTGIVRGNQFLRSGNDGLRVLPPSTPTLINNVALGNAGIGIYAPTAINGGGNVARDNGVADCVGIVCSMY
ncbi:right-handed parallel beta-helix repeat-containing protein [Corallococcus sp. AB049A]|uniref:Right-handed parallel beta-helix repeat-containing protein n=1 Tax=Corallococcus interemptor TaxID=2316720 RepID=A0A3A8QR07_9BACT|nr:MULTISPECIES: right-handed parallel beta-helix repeat-containing protein [Corallococcus]RKH53845.1 right-handed parallel beta-helix repeat-containing protein [Corallococcus sp. AB050B]RKH71209.1 right-handed parallel beta-helix repeat-containing protein [Corallococcus interemptor]RKI74769.1 right-handed parallel beta-helix repeat-containing protein [Corallococcus sp. AB049A]